MPETGLNLDRFGDPGRAEQVSCLHRRAFAWEPQGYIPLGIHVVSPAYGRDLDYDAWLDPEPFLAFQTRVLADTLAVGSDLLPAVAINHLGDALLPSLFGAQLFMPEAGSATLQEVGPTPLPVFADISEVAELPMPSASGGIMPAVERMVRRYREALPPWVRVVAPMPSGPFSAAMELRGTAILLDLADTPALGSRLIEICARLIWATEERLRRLTGVPLGEHVTNFGILGAGLRLGDDSMVNLSPALIRQFCLPAFARVNRLCEYYERHLADLRGRLAIESFYGDAYGYVCERYGSFRAWANDFVPRFRDESGLVLYFQVGSVEEGQEVWARWQEAHRR
jgi:hypothetical protein